MLDLSGLRAISNGRRLHLFQLRWVSATGIVTVVVESHPPSQGPLTGSFPLLSLRTNKADVVIGIEQDVADRLDKSGEKWRVDGR